MKIDKDYVIGLISHVDLTKTPVVLLGIRGFFPAKDERGTFNDALCWITPEGIFAFKANTDPSGYRKGRGTGSQKGMASLKCGTWSYKTGIHNGSSVHPAFRQADKVTVIRDGKDGDYEDTGMFGINIHRGGNRGTSSLGCQTVPPAEWDAFKELGYMALKKYGQKTFPYVLVKA